MFDRIVSTSGIVIILVLFLAVNIGANAALRSVRLDLTEGKLYTLSSGTKNILKSLEEPVTLRFYLSQKLANSMPGINSYAVRVRELLEEYQREADGKVKLYILDPEPFSEEEDRAVGFGLQGIPVNGGNATFYFGLAGTNSVDDEQLIPFFQPDREEFLEYDITRMIYQLAHPEPVTVGLITSLPMQGDPGKAFFGQSGGSEPWVIVEQIEQLFSVRVLEPPLERIADDISVLMIVHPKGLSDQDLYAIDQYVVKGGRALVFIDPYSESEQPAVDDSNPFAAMQAPRNSEFDRLLDAWGVEMATDQVVGDMLNAKKVRAQRGQRLSVVKYPVWMDLDRENFNEEDIVTSELKSIAVASIGILQKKSGSDINLVPLLHSSEQSMQISTRRLGRFADPEELVRNFRPDNKQYVMAARLSGRIRSAFQDGRPAGDTTDATADGHVAESAEPINMIIVADTDMLADRFWVQKQDFFGQRLAIPIAANASFVTNALENLSGSNDLISVRNKGEFSRPFTKVEEIQEEAEKKFREKEKALQDRLRETEEKIRQLQNKKQGDTAFMLSAQQQREINNFRQEKIKIRKELRNVQHELQKDIERLERRMKFFNIGLAPLLVAIGGIIVSLYRSRRRRSGVVFG
jgi:ABC-type uncharacterized transport system involved in gliding motility auxiliary subunit